MEIIFSRDEDHKRIKVLGNTFLVHASVPVEKN